MTIRFNCSSYRILILFGHFNSCVLQGTFEIFIIKIFIEIFSGFIWMKSKFKNHFFRTNINSKCTTFLFCPWYNTQKLISVWIPTPSSKTIDIYCTTLVAIISIKPKSFFLSSVICLTSIFSCKLVVCFSSNVTVTIYFLFSSFNFLS